MRQTRIGKIDILRLKFRIDPQFEPKDIEELGLDRVVILGGFVSLVERT